MEHPDLVQKLKSLGFQIIFSNNPAFDLILMSFEDVIKAAEAKISIFHLMITCKLYLNNLLTELNQNTIPTIFLYFSLESISSATLRAMRSLCSLFFIKPQSIPLNPIQL
jgi:hypothetical protein